MSATKVGRSILSISCADAFDVFLGVILTWELMFLIFDDVIVVLLQLIHLMPVLLAVFAVLHLGFQIRLYSWDNASVDACTQLSNSAVEKMLPINPHANSIICWIW